MEPNAELGKGAHGGFYKLGAPFLGCPHDKNPTVWWPPLGPRAPSSS